jgi:O-acetylhomoserine/O-acetylserine sulfhydrylase-like pyridoxal-dependent enzyme
MNDRIREIARKAGIKMAHDETLALGYLDTAHKKFAELIVRECADIAQQHNKSPVAAPLAIGYVIREHFGVEE